MRITVYDVLSYLAAGDTIEELLEHFPMLTRQDVQACLAYAADAEDRLKLDFTQSYYGPYSGKVRHLLYAVNGFYLRGFEQKQAEPFETLELVVKHKSY